jgi:glutamate 5-kinase
MPFCRIVIKLGTSTLTDGSRRLSYPRMVDLVRQAAELHSQGGQVVIVTSGAVAAGREALGFPELPAFISAKQMLAAIGQPRLMGYYERYFGIYGKVVAQVLLTREDITDRRRYLNGRDTLEALLGQGVIPILNENDTIATEEIRLGDNDNLSALAADLIEADLLALLTDQPGLFTGDPRQNPGARLIPEVDASEIPASLWEAAGGATTGLGTGGMVTKLQAADLARRTGATVVIASGSDPDVLLRIARGEAVGTRLTPVVSALESRKRFILAGMRTTRSLQVDDGAVQAILRGSSLLPVGIHKVTGHFERGDTVRIVDPAGKAIAVGLANYSAHDLESLCGMQSDQIENQLGFSFGDEAVHRNNLLLL